MAASTLPRQRRAGELLGEILFIFLWVDDEANASPALGWAPLWTTQHCHSGLCVVVCVVTLPSLPVSGGVNPCCFASRMPVSTSRPAR